MANWKNLLQDVLLADGVIDASETKVLKNEIFADNVVDQEEVDFLVGLRNGAKSISPEFVAFFL